MTTIILTMMGIVVAAAAAMMVVFYGGGSYGQGGIAAEANQYMNAGANLSAAVDQFRMNERSDPASISQLVDAGYFNTSGSPGVMIFSPGSPGRLTIAGVPADVCRKISHMTASSASDATSSDALQGCSMDGATGTYFAVI